MTDEQIREWVVELQNAIVTSEADQHTLESAARTLIASVRAEAIEEAAKVAEGTDNIGWGAAAGMAHRIAAAIRALAKERKG